MIQLGNGESIETTPEHQLATISQGFSAVSEILPDSELVTHNGSCVLVVSKELHQIPVKVYNLTVENFHTYFVGKTGVWVHNEKSIGLKRLLGGLVTP